jgi:hypothetical protein
MFYPPTPEEDRDRSANSEITLGTQGSEAHPLPVGDKIAEMSCRVWQAEKARVGQWRCWT